jgi:hypothetical protein
MTLTASAIQEVATTESDDMAHFLADALALFSCNKSGHMVSYAYSEPEYTKDPAGGAAFWRDFIQKNHDYYLFL